MVTARRALADTSVFIGLEAERLIAHGIPVVTQGTDYAAMPGVEVIKI